MNILFLSHRFYPFIGGIEVNSEVLATQFHEAGHEVRLMTWTEETGTRTFPFPVIRKPSLKQMLPEHKKADIVFENNPSLQLSWPNLLFRKPIVVAVRTWIARGDGSRHWQDKLKFRWLKRASAVIAISEPVRKQSWPAAVVIGNPYRSDLFTVVPHAARNRDFVFLGRLVSDKGADIAIQALAKVNNSMNVSCKLTIIGDGPEKENLQNISAGLGITDSVAFTGALQEQALVNELNKHLFFLVPSRWEEPFGNVALEGMACGCLPVVSDGGGLPDAVGNAGITFTRGSVDSLAETMKQVLTNSALVEQLHRQAPEHLQNHRPEVVARKYLTVIENAQRKSK